MKYFSTTAEKEFDVDIINSDLMEQKQAQWLNIIQGNPQWLEDSNERTINFAKFICEYMAKKTCLDLNIHIENDGTKDNERAEYIDKVIGVMVDKVLRDKVEDGCALGGFFLKPTGIYNPNNAIDYILPYCVAITEKTSNGDILGAIFSETMQKGKYYFTRLEYHHFEDETVKANDEEAKDVVITNDDDKGEDSKRYYYIEQRAFKSIYPNDLGTKIALSDVKEWEKIEPVLKFEGVEKPLFAYFKMPMNNVIDFRSPEGVSIFNNCINELRDLDIAWSRKSDEVTDSQHITFINEQAMRMPADKDHPKGYKIKLPRFVQGLSQGIDGGSTINEHVPTILVEQRVKEINSTLSMISTKCGCSQGQFVLDRKTGQITATQIESDDQETVQTITDIRNALKDAVRQLVYALNVYCDAYFDLPEADLNILSDDANDEDIFYFRDLLASFEQDRARAMQLLQLGIYSKVKYLTEYEGFSEDEAKQMLEDAQQEKADSALQMQSLFGNAEMAGADDMTDAEKEVEDELEEETDDGEKIEQPIQPTKAKGARVPLSAVGTDEAEE